MEYCSIHQTRLLGHEKFLLKQYMFVTYPFLCFFSVLWQTIRNEPSSITALGSCNKSSVTSDILCFTKARTVSHTSDFFVYLTKPTEHWRRNFTNIVLKQFFNIFVCNFAARRRRSDWFISFNNLLPIPLTAYIFDHSFYSYLSNFLCSIYVNTFSISNCICNISQDPIFTVSKRFRLEDIKIWRLCPCPFPVWIQSIAYAACNIRDTSTLASVVERSLRGWCLMLRFFKFSAQPVSHPCEGLLNCCLWKVRLSNDTFCAWHSDHQWTFMHFTVFYF